jgi:hypothetical protein
MFPAAEKLLGVELLDQLGQTMGERKAELMGTAMEALATRQALGTSAGASASSNGASFR